MKIREIIENKISETASAGSTSAGGVAGFAIGIGSPPLDNKKKKPKSKTKSKLIKR